MSVIEEKTDAPMIVRAMDKGKFVRVNDSFKAKVGFDATELAEKSFLDWIDPRDRTIVQAALENDERLFFARHVTRDGNTLQLRIQLAEHEGGLFVLGQCTKIPTQLESDEARSAEATVSGTLDAIARIIEEQNPSYKCSILLVANGRFVFGAGPSLPAEYNSAVNGYAVGPNVGSCGTAIFWNTPVIVEDIQVDPLWSPLAELAKKAGVAACWSHPFVGSSGSVLGALALYSPEPRAPTTEQLRLLKAAARITGLAVERGRAVEELKRADEAIKVVRYQMQATLDALPDLLFEVDSEGRIFRYHSPRTDLLAVPPEEFMGKPFTDVLPPDAAAPCQRAIDEAAQKGFSYGETYRLAFPHGEHWFELSVAPLHDDAKSNQRFVVISRDITERKIAEEQRIKLEQQFLHTQKQESLSVMAGGIAHDFNNLLMAIMGNANLALMRLNPESPAVDNLKRIEQASARAADLAKQMLAYSGKGKFIVENIDLNILLEEMLHILQVSISKKAVMRLNLQTPLPAVEADATQMRQIIMNLVINASEAIGDKNGVITITTGCMDCDCNYLKDVWLDENLTDGLYVYLEIVDTGCGMDKQTLAKLFDPFFTTKFAGRGLGMAAVLGIVRGHKGSIKVYSELNKGTTFKILLPASSRPAEIFNGAGHHDDWKGEGTVLLVDDEETVRSIGVEMLKELGFSVITADDGREGVEAFRNNPDISFVILDLTMPNTDGEQCFRELQQIKPDIKVIMSSGYNEQEVTQKFVGKGLGGFIQKPYKLSVLREAIQKI